MRGVDDDDDEGDFEDDKDVELLEKLSAIDKNLEDKLALLDHTFGRKGRALEEEIKDLNDPILFALPENEMKSNKCPCMECIVFGCVSTVEVRFWPNDRFYIKYHWVSLQLCFCSLLYFRAIGIFD
ncbi:hypothetical protein IFM89_016809 [Coptis chinensis]|uniref:Uncharacterized protein n=1 Tax=Coptis chinensis TaxID=261450 RepID=A0A835IX28_9MAGN|nr:hypothetical protein IFM89_016809 [Coptis chinensis]